MLQISIKMYNYLMNIKQSQCNQGTALCHKLIWPSAFKGLFAGFTKPVIVPVSDTNREDKNERGQEEMNPSTMQLKEQVILQI